MLNTLKESNPVILLAGVILIPITVAVVSLWVDTRIDERQRELAEDLYQRQQALTVTQTIDAYFQGVGEILLAAPEPAVRDRIIVARTRALLDRLELPRDKGLVVRFISQMRPDLTKRPRRLLERPTSPFIDLSDIDLSANDLSFINLYGADLSGASLRGVNLSWANLAQADLRRADLSGAVLQGADLSGAILSGARLRDARIGGADFGSALLDGADLQGADNSDFEFEGITTQTDFTAANLAGARWLDGSRCRADSVGACRTD